MNLPTRPHRGLLLTTTAACVAALTLTLTGCAGGPPAGPAVPAAPAAASTPAFAVSDPWVKTAESGMTAVFGTFSAAGPSPVTVVSAETSASPRTELHEVVMGDDGTMVMRAKEDGFVIDPGTPRVFAPGGDHIMIMDLASPIRPGDQVEVTLSLSDGSTTRFTALGKETSGGEENYESGGQHG